MMGVEDRFASLLRYRDALDESERELFDMLMSCAREVMASMGQGKTASSGHF
jgi:hypothetical protein